jgi:hypothetical protein
MPLVGQRIKRHTLAALNVIHKIAEKGGTRSDKL